MPTKVTICSDSSLLVGGNPIADLTDDTTEARLTSNLFEMVRDDLLRAHPWTFAIKRVDLSPLSTPPEYGFRYAFNCPSDMLRLLSVDNAQMGIHFVLENRKILADIASIRLRYVYRNEEVAGWAPDFVSTVTYELASQIAYPIAKYDSLRQTLAQQAQYKLMLAKANNGLEIPSQGIQGNPLLDARY